MIRSLYILLPKHLQSLTPMARALAARQEAHKPGARRCTWRICNCWHRVTSQLVLVRWLGRTLCVIELESYQNRWLLPLLLFMSPPMPPMPMLLLVPLFDHFELGGVLLPVKKLLVKKRAWRPYRIPAPRPSIGPISGTWKSAALESWETKESK